MIRMIQLPITTEKRRVTTANRTLAMRSGHRGRHSAAQPGTGARLMTVTAIRAHRMRSTMKHCGISAYAISRVWSTRTAAGRNSTIAPAR